MFNSVALDVFIGLILVFLLYSLLATIFQELIAGALNLRAAVLVKAMRVMLEDRPEVNVQSNSPLLGFFERIIKYAKNNRSFYLCRLPDDTLAKAFYKHPSIKYLNADPVRTKPSYIEPQNFATTLVRVLRGKDYDGSITEMQAIYNTLFPVDPGTKTLAKTSQVSVGQLHPVTGKIETETLDQLRQLYIDAGRDVDKFKASLESWFNETMDRANGWYKRKTRLILFGIGICIALVGNVDTVKIYRILSTNELARGQMVQMAVQAQQAYAPVVGPAATPDTGSSLTPIMDKAYTTVNNDIDKAGSLLGMGWHKSADYRMYDSLSLIKASLASQLQLQDNYLMNLGQQAPPRQEAAAWDKYQKQLNAANETRKSLNSNLSKTAALAAAYREKAYDTFDGFSSILGWLLTALALTLGAPFWFDLLNKFMSIRGTGAKPKTLTASAADPAAGSIPATLASGGASVAAGQQEDQPEYVEDEAGTTVVVQG